MRLSGVKKVTVKLQQGIVIATTDPSEPVLPAASWKEILRVGFKPAAMEIRARASVEEGSIMVDGRRWPVAAPAPAEKAPGTRRLKVRDGAEDPPRVEVLE